MRSRCHRAWWGMALALLVTAAPVQADDAIAAADLEYKVKAGYLFNFAKFVEWPVRTNAETKRAFRIAVLDDGTAFTVVSNTLAGKTVAGGIVEVVRAAPKDNLKNCEMLFITRTAKTDVKKLFADLGTAPVLTVGETEGFAESGGCINLVHRGQNIRFEVNLVVAQKSGLKISSKLASLATVVEPEREDE